MRFDRVWSMPSKNTFSMKPIKQLIEEERLRVSGLIHLQMDLR